jgi:ABC-2 type transport system ATP-binding protein
VTFSGPAPDLGRLPGVRVLPVGESTVRYEVGQGVGPLVAALAGHAVVSLTSREPSLEEIFLHHYDGDGRGRR